jgi:hypothetical protein
MEEESIKIKKLIIGKRNKTIHFLKPKSAIRLPVK